MSTACDLSKPLKQSRSRTTQEQSFQASNQRESTLNNGRLNRLSHQQIAISKESNPKSNVSEKRTEPAKRDFVGEEDVDIAQALRRRVALNDVRQIRA